MEPIRILVVDDMPSQRMQLIRALAPDERMNVVGEASDGQEALALLPVLHPQVVISDMVMPRMDGFVLLERLMELPEEQRPAFIAHTALCRDDFIMRAIGMGAAYYMLKPANVQKLTEQIIHAVGAGPVPSAPHHAPQSMEEDRERLEKYVTSLLLQLGVPAHMNGYKFLREAIVIAVNRPEVLDCVTRELYPAIAQQCDSTASRVERSIRHAIAVTWERTGSKVFNKVLGRYASGSGERPANCEFIAMMAERIRIHLSRQ
ncbi:MAG: sporulation transcription factor Spo0A [Aristaeellaceae bacterium]